MHVGSVLQLVCCNLIVVHEPVMEEVSFIAPSETNLCAFPYALSSFSSLLLEESQNPKLAASLM